MGNDSKLRKSDKENDGHSQTEGNSNGDQMNSGYYDLNQPQIQVLGDHCLMTSMLTNESFAAEPSAAVVPFSSEVIKIKTLK